MVLLVVILIMVIVLEIVNPVKAAAKVTKYPRRCNNNSP
jgi:hypothetical protein